MLLKDKFEGLDTEEISNHHLSFDAFRRVVERVSRVQFDPIRDELGWVEILPSGENRHNLIYDELSFQNALGVMQNHTTIATDPQPLLFFLSSPSRKQKSVPHHTGAPTSPGTEAVASPSSRRAVSPISQEFVQPILTQAADP